MSKKIMIDPGHAPGNVNGGKNGYKEYAGMWKVSNYLKAALERCGCAVALTRGENEDPTLTARGKKAKGYDLLISEHTNAADGSARGVEVYYSIDLPGDKNFAAALSKAVSAVMSNPDRGAKIRESTNDPGEDFYTVMDAAQDIGTPHVLLTESGFHDNVQDESFLLKDENLKAIAEAQAKVICNYLGVTYQTTCTNTGTVIAKTPIMGSALLNAACLASYLLKTNPAPKINCTALELAQHYITEGQAEGVRGDVAFCQAIHETGWFRYGGDVLPEQNNFCGLGATNATPTGKGAWFDTPQLGVRAQIQHLKAYASKDALKNACIDPRFGLVPRGIAANWEDLAGRWAVPGYDSKKYSGIEAARVAGETYGQKILAVFLNAVKTKPEGEGQTITLVIGGDVLSVPAENVEGRWTVTMPNGVKVVLRDILTVLGYTSITWEESTKTIIATK